MKEAHRDKITELNKFQCVHIPLRDLKNQEERRYIAFVYTYVTDILNATPSAKHYTVNEVVKALQEIGNAFPDENYWEFHSFDKQMYIHRKGEKKWVATVVINNEDDAGSK